MELDPREVLFLLNQKGYKNITKTQLKDFIIDLQKLIAHETQSTKCSKGDRNFVQECIKSLTAGAKKDVQIQESTPTVIEQKASKKISRGVCTEQFKVKESSHEKPIPNSESNKENISRPCSRTSKTSVGTKTYSVDDDSSHKDVKCAKMWIRTSRPKSAHHKSDPVELYHKYKKEWEKHKQLIPGENDHSDLRWQIRCKLLS